MTAPQARSPLSIGRGWHRRALAALLLLPSLYVAWLGMMTVHELGHVFHAWLSGGAVSAVRIPLAGFSITEYSANPHPHFVAWGGPVWGSAIPTMVWAFFKLVRWPGRTLFQFFAGFCLIANGVYLGVGGTMRAGDAADLVRYGTPLWVLIMFGVVATCGGLLTWHFLGKRRIPPPSPPSAEERG